MGIGKTLGYITIHSSTDFSHSIYPTYLEEHYLEDDKFFNPG